MSNNMVMYNLKARVEMDMPLALPHVRFEPMAFGCLSAVNQGSSLDWRATDDHYKGCPVSLDPSGT